MIRWLASRVGVIYIILYVFCLTCLDLKALDTRIKLRHLNDAIPDFSSLIIFSQGQNSANDVMWKSYTKYFELILRYMPDDLLTKQLLGYVDYYTGQEQKAIDLFKSSDIINGQSLFWPDYNLGVIYYKNGMYPQAASYLLKAVASSTKLNEVLMQDSIVYKQILINPFFKYSLYDKINEAQSSAFVLLLSSLFNLRQFDKMILISDIGLVNQNPSHKDALYFYAGIGFFETGQMEKALLLFNKSLTIEKNNPETYYYLASIYQNAGKLEQARELFKVSYALHQKNDPRFPYEKHMDLRFF